MRRAANDPHTGKGQEGPTRQAVNLARRPLSRTVNKSKCALSSAWPRFELPVSMIGPEGPKGGVGSPRHTASGRGSQGHFMRVTCFSLRTTEDTEDTLISLGFFVLTCCYGLRTTEDKPFHRSAHTCDRPHSAGLMPVVIACRRTW